MASEFPKLFSLEELEIVLAPEVRLHLASQYQPLYENDDQTDATAAAERHLDRVLHSMKMAPATSTCRVNQILATTEQVREGLEKVVNAWGKRHHYHDGDNDIETHDVNGKSTIITAHPLLEDLLTIGLPQSGDGDTFSNSAAKTQNLLKCRVPLIPPTNRPYIDDDDARDIFPNWDKRGEKGWPLTHRVVICDRFCGEAVLRGSDIFVRGVQCSDTGILPEHTVAVYADVNDGSYPNIPRGLRLQDYTGRCVFLGLGTSKCTRTEMMCATKGVAIEMSSRAKDRAGPALPPLHGVLPGTFMLQNLPSVLVAHALSPQVNDVILDMCSAPGGKTAHVASMLRNRGTIVACDKSRKKMVSARDFFRTMGATSIIPLALDSTKCVCRDNGSPWKGAKEILSLAKTSAKDGLLKIKAFYPKSFDRIILDPPCSALGLRPKLQVEAAAMSDLEKYARYQRLFVKEAVSLLKDGGTMTYSTCTILAGENELMVRHILDEYPCMELVPIDIHLGVAGLPGMGLSDLERSCVRRFDPSDELADTMGFFVSKFVKSFRK